MPLLPTLSLAACVACASFAAPPKPALARVDPTAVTAFTTDREYRILRYAGHAFPYRLVRGVPTLQEPSAPAGPGLVRCVSNRGRGRIAWADLAHHLALAAWPKGKTTPFMGTLYRASGRWELLVTEGADELAPVRGLPLAGFPGTTAREGQVLIIGHLDDALESADQRNEAFLVVDRMEWLGAEGSGPAARKAAPGVPRSRGPRPPLAVQAPASGDPGRQGLVPQRPEEPAQ